MFMKILRKQRHEQIHTQKDCTEQSFMFSLEFHFTKV